MTEATLEDSEAQSTPSDVKAAGRRAMLTGPIVPTLMSLALPTITVLVAQTMVGIAETYYVGLLGTDALVGTSVVFPIWMLMTMTSAGGIGSGVASAVARAIGAGRTLDADDLVLHAVTLAITFGLAFTLGTRVFGSTLYHALGARVEPLAKALSYSNWLFLGAVPIWVVNLCSASLRGAGNVKTPAMVTLVGALVLIPLSPLLIFGLGTLPGLGVAGAGIAVTTYYTVASIVLLRHLARGKGGLTLRLGALRWRLFRDILGVGTLSALSGIQLNLAVVLVTGAMSHFGSAALAGYGIGSRLDYLLIPMLFGLGSAVLTMVGTCVGARDIPRAKRIALAGTVIGAGFSGAVGLVVGLCPAVWIGLFTRETPVLQAGGTYLHAVAPFYAAVGTTFILGFASQGAARPLLPLLAGTVRLLIAAGIGMIAVHAWGVDMFGLSVIVACASLASAIVCLLGAWLGLIWPTPAKRMKPVSATGQSNSQGRE
jgi:putative MATE family efflux protein